MKYFIFIALPTLLCISCIQPRELSSTDPVNWDKRTVKTTVSDSLETGSTFLSIYSQIYMRNDEEQSDLTVTVSLHNPNLNEQLFIDKAVYYNTHGEPIRTYFDKTIFINPMETVQIVIDGIDKEGGTGANFVFDWKTKKGTNEPIFEAVMINTYGQQGISFVTTGKRILK
ncbi:DUF3124 domain-containing protein [Jejudonia soesokkakensis]|uniref:DUF3124 domain-containing protein n=1 Tax=Jejudonia soesokkakensis TaxID=1323432 RepID=A0ABW2MS70_9FLAO